MKRIIQLACIGIILLVASCKDQGDEINPLVFMTCKGDKTLTVKATYNGSVPTSNIGSKKIYVYLFKKLGLTSRKPAYEGSTAAEAATGVEQTITINNVCDGEYYVLALYDYRSGDNPDNQTDRYVMYGGAGPVGFTSIAAKYIVSGDQELQMGEFGDTYRLQNGSVYMRPCTLTVNATYNGTDYNSAAEMGSGRLFVYLYDSMGTSTRSSQPAWVGSTSLPASIGTETPIVLEYITAGSYYAVLFYDYSGEVGHNDSEDDRYIIHNDATGTQLAGQATKITVAENGSATWNSAVFGDSYTLQTDSAYMTLPVSLTVNASYTGTGATTGTGDIYVYLYTTLKRGTRLTNDVFTPTYSGHATPSSGNATITIPGVDQGSYYVVVFYDNALGSGTTPNPDSPTDRYSFYSSAQYPANADVVSLTGDTTLPTTVTFGDSYTFQTNAPGDTLYMQPGSLDVHLTYTGTDLGTADGSKKIYVYLYDALGMGTRSTGYYPIYTASTSGAVTQDVQENFTISNICPGNYYVLVFLDWKKPGGTSTNPDNASDRYILYNGTQYTVDATPLSISTGSNNMPAISFGADYLLQSGSAFIPKP